MTLLIQNGRIINPNDRSERRADLLVRDGVIRGDRGVCLRGS